MPATITPAATYTVAAACRRPCVSPAVGRRGWDGVFTRLLDGRGRAVLDRQEVEEAAQFAGDRGRMIAAVLALRPALGRLTG